MPHSCGSERGGEGEWQGCGKEMEIQTQHINQNDRMSATALRRSEVGLETPAVKINMVTLLQNSDFRV
jgi:hypothetical protein